MIPKNCNRTFSTGFFIFSILLFYTAVSQKDSTGEFKSGRIVGGEYVLPSEIPYQVSVYFLDKYVCSAAIIDTNFVVTTGSCGVLFTSETDMHVIGGDLSLRQIDGTEQQIGVKNSTVHPGYNSWTLTNDIALLELETPFNFTTAAVKPIQLAPKGRRPSNTALVSGWGAIEENGPSSDTLRKASLAVHCKDVCRTYYKSTEISDGMLCAGVPEEGRDTCNGDNGAPLVCFDDEVGFNPLNGKFICGIASWGRGCGRVPAVFTEISYYYEWIHQYLNPTNEEVP